jgi:renalase
MNERNPEGEARTQEIDEMKRRIAIIGAGVSGLAAAWELRETNAEVTVFEKSRGVSGRAASRSRNGARYDHGANYFKTDSDAMTRLVHEELSRDGLVDIGRDIWTFDGAGTLVEGDAAQNAEPKWTYADGISTLGKRLAVACGAEVVRELRIGGLDEGAGGWTVRTDEGDEAGSFDAVLLTPPAPQAIELLEGGVMDEALRARLIGGLRGAEYYRQFSVVLNLGGEIERPGDFYALLNSDRKHMISWISFENDKPTRVPVGETVLIVQMSPKWSAQHFEEAHDVIAAEAWRGAAALLKTDRRPLKWFDVQRWRFAHPVGPADGEVLSGGEESCLFFAGDALIGKGRVSQAIESGLGAASRMRLRLGLG